MLRALFRLDPSADKQQLMVFKQDFESTKKDNCTAWWKSQVCEAQIVPPNEGRADLYTHVIDPHYRHTFTTKQMKQSDAGEQKAAAF